ncbi:alpha/beta fold hydrolase [Rhodobacteraceae bacterium N5(2021)]|uniref:Alpha/beta fold hydrolase n=1 Tax=Gymnodinialimonas phycosphaerae TaxID=2841589 RepID=A0A975YFW4_9RHOB|nr:alpha/beta fold hydrolase [Gymnodinialimonas phycosphaerae]MBY4895138.1 alpha/beta fold hydrolase [Gymnodinialimonas phycosphaerae]
MRRVLRALLRVVFVGAIGVISAHYFVPREQMARYMLIDGPDLDAPAEWLAEREARFDDITPGAEARIVWAGEEGAASDVVIVYLHGFSATAQEIRPVPDRVAEALGANLIFARLPGHGRSGAAMGAPRAGDWRDETARMLHLARGIGNRVVIIGTSTGGTLASYAATDTDMARDLAAVVLISPNYELANPLGWMLEMPFARLLVPLVAGTERRFDPINADHNTFWTTAYPTSATVTLGTLLRTTRARDVSGVSTPALFLFSDADQVISAPAVRDFAARWGGSTTLIPIAVPEEGGDPFNHVIAGDILSPALTDRVAEDITDWLRETLQ